ncbi:Uu.00g139410.m01.CDS01 [Anthostomella pinea]|uniref:Uu.00g139410.m01.CDS01 n=1 Tax=Anthostomella pinea TaxID=933095 RepID=A0AAI8YLF0_9PEZI|nr:Uu.00g139410.m01.CDS01 [Anthostomella pinea]
MPNSKNHPLVSHQPIKLLFQLTYLGTVVARLPIWIIASLVPALRPHPEWTAKQTFLARVAHVVTDLDSRIGITQTLSLEPQKEGSRFRLVKPLPREFFSGPLESDIEPETVGGTWYPEAPSAPEIASKTVILHLHGGAFVLGDGRTEFSGFTGKNFVEQEGLDYVFMPQYRLSGYRGVNPFPAALQDCFAAYMYLLNDLKIPSNHITLSGDSAGGNLVIAMLRYIEERGDRLKIPRPRAIALLSPWVSPMEFDIADKPNRAVDYTPTSFLRWGAETYPGHVSHARSHPYITPLGNPFATWVPIFVNTGSAEVFLDDNTRWVDEMKKVEGNSVELHLENAAVHDTFLIGERLGFDASARDVASVLRDFVRKA